MFISKEIHGANIHVDFDIDRYGDVEVIQVMVNNACVDDEDWWAEVLDLDALCRQEAAEAEADAADLLRCEMRAA